MDQKGLLSSWNDAKGFGFISPDGGGERVFAHISAYEGRGRPSPNRKVVYVQGKDKQGRVRAARFQYSGAVGVGASVASGVWAALLLATGLTGGLVALCLLGYVSWLVPGAYGAMSVVAFLMYAVDKGAAEKGRRRVPEARLHLFELLCGWPGALLGQQFFRHKTRKTSFQVGFWFCVILNLAALTWVLIWPEAAAVRQQLGIEQLFELN